MIGKDEISLKKKNFEFTCDMYDFDLVVLMSDGIHSFKEIEQSLVPYAKTFQRDIDYLEVSKELFQFKQMNGVFIQRRCQKFFKNCKGKGWYHFDDFSMAGIYVSES